MEAAGYLWLSLKLVPKISAQNMVEKSLPLPS